MGIRNQKLQLFRRLEAKTLDRQFEVQVREGLGCSPFEAKAVLEVVRDVYGPYLGETPANQLPGCLTLMCIDAEEPGGKAVVDCQLRAVTVRLHRGEVDDRLLREQGPGGFRRERLPDLCQEVFSQGGLATREDLAYRVFCVSVRTISRDLAWWRLHDPERVLPLRSHLQDIGPVLTHRERIVELALDGRTTTEICRIVHHSPEAVGNYLQTFARCAFLDGEGMQAGQIAYLLRRGRRLVESYLELLASCRLDRNRQFHLRQLLEPGQPGGGKKDATGGAGHGR